MTAPLHINRFVMLCLVSLLGLHSVSAQPEMKLPAAAPAIPTLLLKQIVSTRDFSAHIEINTAKTNRDAKAEIQRGTLLTHDGAVRLAMSATGGRIFSSKAPAPPYVLLLPAKHVRYTVLEAIDGYAESPLEEVAAHNVEVTELSRKKENGRMTVCSRYRIQTGTNPPQEALLWVLPEQLNLPVKMEWSIANVKIIATLKDFWRPDKFSQSDFQLPTDLKRYASEDDLMAELLSRLVAMRPKPPFEGMPSGGPPSGKPPGGGGPPGGGPP